MATPSDNTESITMVDREPSTTTNSTSSIKSSRSKPSITPSTSRSTSSSTIPSSSSSSNHCTPTRKDLFDDSFDESYHFTKPTSTIPPPTLGNAALERVWRDKTNRSLLSFQRRKKTNEQLLAEKEPNNEIMKLLLRESVLETDTSTVIRLKDCVLTLVYSSQTQQKQLCRAKNRWNNRRNNRYENNNNNAYRYDPSWYDKLPGPQPHSITRQNLDRLRSYCYWVTEKSDGIRFMMLITNSPSFEAYFVDRKFEFYRITHSFYKVHLNSVNGATLLDGELIVNGDGLLEYLAFDCIAMKGRSWSNECTSSRVEYVSLFIKEYGRELDSFFKTKPPPQVPPIVLRAKKHWKATDIEELLRRIRYEKSECEYFFENAERRTKNDGLIFTPQENNYLMSYDPGALVKWKFLEKNTIDLKVKTPYIWRDKLDLYAGGKGNSDIVFAVINMRDKRNRTQFHMLLDEMKRLSSNRCGFVASFIIECGWNFEEKQWRLIQNRPDKHIANFITVCTDTLRVMMDNVTKQELIDACKPMVMPPTQTNTNQMTQYGGGGGGNNNNSYSNQYH